MDTLQRSYKVGVKTSGDRDWGDNGLRFATEGEATRYGNDLYARWTAVRELTVTPSTPSTDVPNYAIVDGALVSLPAPAPAPDVADTGAA